MAPATYHLLFLRSAGDAESFEATVRSHVKSDQIIWLGRPQCWFRPPALSRQALLVDGSDTRQWDYLLIGAPNLSKDVEAFISTKWSVSNDSPDFLPHLHEIKAKLAKEPSPQLPDGWSPKDLSGLENAIAPLDVHLTLDTQSQSLSYETSHGKTSLRDVASRMINTHQGPIVVMNLLSYEPGQRAAYNEGYVGGFIQNIKPVYGAEAIHLGPVSTWSSREAEQGQQAGWEDAALVWYPSILHFAKMLDDPAYLDLDRKFKKGALVDNPLLCCIEVDLSEDAS